MLRVFEDAMNFKPLLIITTLGLCTFVAGCSRGFDIKTPDGFAELDGSSDYRYRSTSADGVVIAVRREKNEPFGSLDFWSAVLENELERRGYRASETKSVKSKDGATGTQLRLTKHDGGRPNVLWVTVFVRGSHLVVIEAGGDAEHFARVKGQVDSAVQSVDLG